MGNKSVLWLNEITSNEANEVGEKAFLLSKVYNKKQVSNLSIPEGFVITKKAINSFLEEKQIKKSIINILEEINIKNEEEIERAETKIQELIIKTEFPKELTEEIFDSYETLGVDKLEIEKGSAYDILLNSQEPVFVAIRNSNDQDIGDSYYCIKGNSQIIATIKKCLTSLFRKENIKDFKEKEININDIATSILIQKQIQSDKSGTVFIDDTYKINAIWGLGGGLKQEEIEKDEYIIRRDGRILQKNVGEKKYAVTRNSGGNLKAVQLKEGYSHGQVLEEYEMQKLGDIALNFEDTFKKHIKFHFAIENDEINVVFIEENLQANKIQEPIKEETQAPKKEEPIKAIESQIQEPIIENTISPIENVTNTKTGLILETEFEAEDGQKTLIKEGLINLEKIIQDRGIHPLKYIENYNTKGYEEVLASGILKTSKHLDSIWVKLSDFTTTEFEKLEGAPEKKEENPLMGLTGIRFLLSYPELLKREIKAISSMNNEKNQIGLLIPKVSSVYEIKKVKEFAKDLNINLKIGVILETPASIQLIKDFIEEEIDAVFFSGDNLTKYLLAIDPQNKKVEEFYDNTSPALMYQLEYVIRVCKRRNIHTAFYGSATKNKEMVEYLIKKNIDSILTTPKESNNLHKRIKEAEEKHIEGTDREKRQYELTKEKERQKKEIEEFEKLKEEQVRTEIKTYPKDEEAKSQKPTEKTKEKEIPQQEPIIENKEQKPTTENEEPKGEVTPTQGLPENVNEMPNSVEEAMKLIEEQNKKAKESPRSQIPEDVEKAMKSIEEDKELIEKRIEKEKVPEEITKAEEEIHQDKEELEERIEAESSDEILEIEEQLPEDIEELELSDDEEIKQEVLYDPTQDELSTDDSIGLSEDEDFEEDMLELLEEEEERDESNKDDPLGIF